MSHPPKQRPLSGAKPRPQPGSPSNAAIGSSRPCDVCRKRKIKCIPFTASSAVPGETEEKCRGCTHLGVVCSHNYVNKKPGRPLGSTKKSKEEKLASAQTLVSHEWMGSRTTRYSDEDDSNGSNAEYDGGSYSRDNPIRAMASLPFHVQQLESAVSSSTPKPPSLPDPSQTFRPSYAQVISPSARSHVLSPSDDYYQRPTPFAENKLLGLHPAGSDSDLWPMRGLDKSPASGSGGPSPYPLQLTAQESVYSDRSRSQRWDGSDRGMKRKAPLSPPAKSVNWRDGMRAESIVSFPYDADGRSPEVKLHSLERRGSMAIGRLIESDQTRMLGEDDGRRAAMGSSFMCDNIGQSTPDGLGYSIEVPAGSRSYHRNSVPHRDSFTSATSGHTPNSMVKTYTDLPIFPTSTGTNVSAPTFPPVRTSYPFENQDASPPLEEAASFSVVSQFISLYLRYQHALVPIVHKPTFNSDVSERRDQRDPEFRALLLSLVAYVICQVPITKMPKYDRKELEYLQKRCHDLSKRIQEHVRKDKAKRGQTTPTLTMLAILIADYFYCESGIGPGKLSPEAAVTLGEAARLAYVMDLHKTENGSTTYTTVELELRKRIFWQLYNTDKTCASAGMPVMMHDFEGVPDFPICVDDDLITERGSFSQPENKPSYMSGFVALARLFQIMGECLLLKKQNSARGQSGDASSSLEWITKGERRVEEILRGLPDVLRPTAPLDEAMDLDDIFSVQRANLLITAVSVKFELLNFKGIIVGAKVIQEERASSSMRWYNLLSNTPVEHLAANGEAMRGKVWRILGSLFGTTAETFNNEAARKWWDIFARVSFVQVKPSKLEENANSDDMT